MRCRRRALVSAQRVGRVVEIFAEHIGEHGGVLDRHAGALRKKGQHRAGGIPDQRHRDLAAAERRAAVVERPFEPAIGSGDEFAGLLRPGQRAKWRKISSRSPVLQPDLVPAVVDDTDDVDEAPPRSDSAPDGRPARARDAPGARDILPAPLGGTSARQAVRGGTRRLLFGEARGDARPDSVGADQRDAGSSSTWCRACLAR